MITEIISVVGAIVMAIITASIPLLQSLINKKSEEDKIKIENLYKSKLSAFQDLMISFGHFRKNSRAHVDEFLSCLCKATLYCDEILAKKLLGVIQNLSNEEFYKNAYDSFEGLIPYFSNEIKATQNEVMSLHKKRRNAKDNATHGKNDPTKNKQ